MLRRQKLFGLYPLADLHHPRDEPGPSGLMTRADTGAVVSMKVLIEKYVIAPVRIVLEFFGCAVNRAPAMFVAQKNFL